MSGFLSTIISLIGPEVTQTLKDTYEIHIGQHKDKVFEKFYKTFVNRFVDTQKGLDRKQAAKFFSKKFTRDGVFIYFCCTDPNTKVREHTRSQLVRYAGYFKISEDSRFTNEDVVERFLKELESALKQQADKTLLPHVKDIRDDIHQSTQKILDRLDTTKFPGTEAERIEGSLPPVWNLPHHRNPNFTGREDILNTLRAALTDDRAAALTQAIHGLGGVGKTQLAIEYAYRCQEDYDVVWWLRSENPTVLAGDYAGLATALKLSQATAPDQQVSIQAVKQWLGQHDKWLLIFDNALESRDVSPYIPQSCTGHVIITSRNRNWRGVTKSPLMIEVLKREESVAFLMNRTGQVKERDADALAEALGDLPLALEQAGAYIESTGQTIPGYLALFREQQQELLKRGELGTDYPDTVATTWDVTFDAIQERSPDAVALLYVLAFLAPDNIPRELFQVKLDNVPPSLEKVLTDPLIRDDAIAMLHRYAIVEVTDTMLSIHRLVQAVVQNRIAEGKQRTWAETVLRLVNQIFPEDSDDVRTWQQCAVLMPHAQAVTTEMNPSLETQAVSRLLNQMGLYLYGRGDYTGAEPLYQRALEIWETQLGADHPSVATTLNNLAELFRTQGKYSAAESLYQRALKIDEAQLGADHPDVATDLNNLALLFYAQGKYSAAEPLYQRALKIRETQLGADHPDVAASLNNLAALFRAQGKYSAAEPLYQRAFEIYEDQLGANHPLVATSLNNLAALFEAQGKYSDAEPLYQRALEIWENQLGADHPLVATSLNNLAGLLEAQGKYSAAEPLYQRALEILKTRLGDDHPNTQTCRNNYNMLLDELKAQQGKNER